MSFRTYFRNSEIFYPLYGYLRRFKYWMYSFISDERYAKKYYKNQTGRELNLQNPITFDEKLWWLKLNYKNPLMTICSDKYLVREYVKEQGLECILNELYGVYYSVDTIDVSKLPEDFFLKCNHISGGNMKCNKADFSLLEVKKKLGVFLNVNYFFYSREWNYKNIKPCIIAEKVLKDNSKLPFLDYKFMCFSGEPKLLFLDIGVCREDGSHSEEYYRNIYDMDFNPVAIKETREHYDYTKIRKPENFGFMIECARKLSKPFPHCRVDLYNINGVVIFGEITFFHGGGCNDIQPKEAAVRMGNWIVLERFNTSCSC